MSKGLKEFRVQFRAALPALARYRKPPSFFPFFGTVPPSS